MQATAENWVSWLAAALSLGAAVISLVIASPAAPADYKVPPTPVLVVAGVAYLVGAGLILVADRRLLLLGAILNPLVLAAYLAAAINRRAAIDGLSLTGKAAQVALEVALVWLILRPTELIAELG